jgi:hypothetical protein
MYVKRLNRPQGHSAAGRIRLKKKTEVKKSEDGNAEIIDDPTETGARFLAVIR